MSESQTTTLPLGARIVTMQRLRVGELKRVRDELLLVKESPTGEFPTVPEIQAMTKVVHAVVQISEPSLTLEQFTAEVDLLDFDEGMLQLAKLFTACVTKSGVKKLEGEGTGAPADAAASADVPSTSAASTD